MSQASVSDADERDYSALVADLDNLAANAKSFFPGRVLLPRKKTFAVLDLLSEKLLQDTKGQNQTVEFEGYTRALEAVAGVNGLASGGNAGPSIWRIRFADVNRKRLTLAIQDLHTALKPFLVGSPSEGERT